MNKFGEGNSFYGKKHSEESRRKMSISAKSRKRNPCSEETKVKLSLANKGKNKVDFPKLANSGVKKGTIPYNKGKKMPETSGENNFRWIKDRTLLKDDHRDRGGQLHRYWSKSVKIRDGFKCKINNKECNGRVESHHILSWNEHPELRYSINNGITLCHFHHPKRREDEKMLIPTFQSMVEAIRT